MKAGIIDRFHRSDHDKALRRAQQAIEYMRNIGVTQIHGKRCRVLLRRYHPGGEPLWIVFGALGDVPKPDEYVTEWYYS